MIHQSIVELSYLCSFCLSGVVVTEMLCINSTKFESEIGNKRSLSMLFLYVGTYSLRSFDLLKNV